MVCPFKVPATFTRVLQLLQRPCDCYTGSATVTQVPNSGTWIHPGTTLQMVLFPLNALQSNIHPALMKVHVDSASHLLRPLISVQHTDTPASKDPGKQASEILILKPLLSVQHTDTPASIDW